MSGVVKIEGLDQLIKRMEAYPKALYSRLKTFGNSLLEIVGDEIPAYPPPPQGSKYIRTERLGKSLGSGFGGGRMGKPDIYEVKTRAGWMEATFGTRLSYAPYVVGDPSTQQAGHMRHWWTLIVTVVARAMPAIDKRTARLAKSLAKYLAGKEGGSDG